MVSVVLLFINNVNRTRIVSVHLKQLYHKIPYNLVTMRFWSLGVINLQTFFHKNKVNTGRNMTVEFMNPPER